MPREDHVYFARTEDDESYYEHVTCHDEEVYDNGLYDGQDSTIALS